MKKLVNAPIMYQYPNQEPYHHNSYTNLEVAKLQNVNTICQQHYHQVLPQNLFQNLHQNTSEDPRPQPEEVNNEKISPNKSKVGVKKLEPSVMPKKSTVDTSNFSVEERLVAAVWVHERRRTRDSINEIKLNFKKRFGRDPPSKTTLFAWERKLFSTGNVSDAPRTGRPVHRKQLIPRVAASVNAAPALSLRARALALSLPRSTLHHILRHDLSHEPATKPKHQADNKRPVNSRVRQSSHGRGRSPPASAPAVRSCRPQAPCPAPLPPPQSTPAPLPPSLPAPQHSHMHYVMHAMHTRKHPLSLGYS